MPLTTDVAIRKWKPTGDGQAESTGGRNGLYVRGWLSGRKVFYFRGKSWIKIGDYPATTLATARELSVVAKRLAKQGFGTGALQAGFAHAKVARDLEDIVSGTKLAGVSGRSIPTYDEMFRDWFSAVEPTLQEGPSRRRPQAIHELHLAPKIGSRPISEIRRREIFEVLSVMFQEIPVTAGHALGHLNKIFERAINLELVEGNPVPPRSAFPRNSRKIKHHGTLPPDKMSELWSWVQTRSASQSAKLAILAAMCTGHRMGVVVNAEWRHIDAQTGVWTVPARTDKSTPGRMKSGREYALQLPAGLLARLRAVRTNDQQRYLFESPSTTGPISPNAIFKIIKCFDESLTAHGFRNAIKIWCRNADPAVPDHVADAFCDHSLRGLDASYRRSDTSKQRYEIAERLYRFITSD